MNIYEIAEKAGVSIATVSRVINNNPNVSSKTREKIRKLMEEENYFPSSYARGLTGSTAKTVGILTIDIRDQYYASVIHSIEQELSLQQYNVILCNTGGEYDDQRNYISLLMQKNADAIVLVGSVFNNPGIKKVISTVTQKIPVIIVNENLKGKNIYSVTCNETKGVKRLVDKLYQDGHRNFLFVKAGDTYSSNRKEKGFVNTHFKDLGVDTSKIITIDKGLDAAKYCVKDILGYDPRPTAIVCSEDLTALGIIEEFHAKGYKVPEDFSVTGFNNSIYSVCSYPNITTIDSQSSAMGLSTARVVLDVLNSRQVPAVSTLEAEVIIRDSSK